MRMSQHHLGLHKIQLVFHFCLYMPCDTKYRTFFRMALLENFEKKLPAVPVDGRPFKMSAISPNV